MTVLALEVQKLSHKADTVAKLLTTQRYYMPQPLEQGAMLCVLSVCTTATYSSAQSHSLYASAVRGPDTVCGRMTLCNAVPMPDCVHVFRLRQSLLSV